nr:hypothetical protein [Tanacetum cinerariifolium]
MSSLFADTYNVVAILEKSDAVEGFEQIIDFLSRSYIHYALTVNPHIYISCIKQFWNTASLKRLDDVTRLQALVNKKKIMISEVVIREILQLDDAEGMVCLPNEEIFAGLAQMGYEKPSTKLTFYKAFFSRQWKFLIHTLLQSLSAKRTSWNEFSTSMASAVIYLSKGQKFNFLKYIFDSLIRNVDSSSKFYMYPRFIQLIIQNQIGDLSTHTTRFISPALTQKAFANMRRVRKGFSGVETPLFEGMLAARQLAEEGIEEEQVQATDVVVAAVQETVTKDFTSSSPHGAEFPTHLFQQVLDTCSALTHRVKNLEHDKAAQKLEIIKVQARVKRLERANKVKSSKFRRLKKVRPSKRIESSDDIEDVFNQGRMIDDLDKDKGIELVVDQVKDADIVKTEGRHAAKQPSIPAAAPTVVAAYTRRRKGVIIRDLKEELSSKTPVETPKLKDKGKGILIKTPKPMKKKDQIELDAEYARKLHEEINKDIDWDAAIDHVKQKSKNPQYIKRYQVMNKRPQTESEARKNMMIYLKNTAVYKLDFFKGMSYDEICPIFQARFDANMRFLFKSREEMEEEDQEVLKSINETPPHKAAKRRKLNKESQEAEDLKKHLEVVDDEDDDVFTEATPLARKNVPSFVPPSEQVKTPRPSVKPVENSIPTVNPKTYIPQPKTHGNSRNRKACFILLTKSKLVPVTVARQVTTVVSLNNVTRLRPAKTIVTKPYSPLIRNINRRPSPKASTFPPKVTATKASMGNPQHALKDKGVIDSGCSRYMTGNMSYMSDFEEINGGYVAFGGNPKGGEISSKGKIKTGKLDFDDVYFVKELKFNLFSILHMCDKKNIVLFIDTECIVLSLEFKFLDENQVLLRVPRENNMYNVDLKNIVPSGDLTYKEPEFEGRKPESEVHVSPSSSAQTKKHDDKTNREARGKIHFLLLDSSQYPDDPNMPTLEDITYSDDDEDVGAEADFTNLETTITISPIPTTKVHKDHPVTQIIGDLSLATQIRSMTRVVKDQGGLTQINNKDFHTCMFAYFLSQDEPKKVHQALKDPSWIESMQEELLQFKTKKVWVLVDLPNGKRAIGHTQEEGIDYEEVFAPVAKIEAIRLFLAYASFMGFMVYQMDVKSAFLYETIKEEVYVCQPLGFEDPNYPNKVYKVVKAFMVYIKLLKLDQMVSGKDSSNLLMADNLPKIVWYSTHHVALMKSWLVQKQTALGQTATGKENSNPFMVGSLPKTMLLTLILGICINMILLNSHLSI